MLRSELYTEVMASRDTSSSAYKRPNQLTSAQLEHIADVLTLNNFTSNEVQNEVQKKIQQLRESDFDFVSENGDTWIKHHQQGKKDLDPINPFEAEIQALRYLQGMLLIAKNLRPQNASFEDGLNKSYADYVERQRSSENSTKDTHELAENFAKLLVEHGIAPNLEKARSKQLVMARDLAIMLEKHPAVITISEREMNQQDQVVIQRATPYKIDAAYYDSEFFSGDEFAELSSKVWFQQAKSSAGLSKVGDSWLDNFFRENLATLRDVGSAAPPSARWLPLPANNQTIEIVTAKKDKDSQSRWTQDSYSRFTRMGITSAFHVKDVREQRRLAVKQLQEILEKQIWTGIQNYKEKYQDFDPMMRADNAHTHYSTASAMGFDYFADYQTLLTPHVLEAYAYRWHTDNNAKFVEMAKEAMQGVKQTMIKEYDGEVLGDGSVKFANGAKVYFGHTNASVNSASVSPSAKQFKGEDLARIQKVQALAKVLEPSLGDTLYIQYMNGASLKGKALTDARELMEKAATRLEDGTYDRKDSNATPELQNASPELRKELAMRLRAAFYLRAMLNKDEPFKELYTSKSKNAYKRNSWSAAFGLTAKGWTGGTLMGCKSGRDRTAVEMAAIEAMAANPEAMKNWDVLDKSICRSLEEGHGFRSMSWHNAVVKVSDVHGYFMGKLSPSLQTAIKSLKRFSNKLPEFKEGKKAAKQSSTAKVQAALDISEVQPRPTPPQQNRETVNSPAEPVKVEAKPVKNKGMEILDEERRDGIAPRKST